MSHERHDRILALVKARQVISITDLSQAVNVSEMTIRRDVAQLASEGRLLRYRGGAAVTRSASNEPPFFVRQAENQPDKMAIGKALAATVRPGEMVFLDVGSTILEVARNLPTNVGITILTNWIPIAVTAAQRGGIQIYMLGGTVRGKELSMVGYSVVESLRGFNVDRAVIGAGGISLERGVTDYNLEEVAVKRAAIHSAKRVVLAVDHSKIGRIAPVEVCGLAQVKEVFTSAGAPAHFLNALEGRGIGVTVPP